MNEPNSATAATPALERLASARPASPSPRRDGLAAGAAMPVPAPEFSLLQYWLAVRRHLVKIALFVVVAVITTTILVVRMPKQYQSTAVIRMDPSTPEATVGQQNNSNSAAMPGLLATDQTEIASPSVVGPALHKLGLKSAGTLTVTQPAGTYFLNVTDRSLSPDNAAGIANAVAAEFIRHEYQTRSTALLDLSGYMRGQIEDLRARMEKSQLALNQYELANGIVDANGASTLLNQSLAALQTELQKEQARQRSLEADLTLVKNGSLNDLLVSDRGQTLAPLIQAQQQEELDFDSLAANLGPANYLYKQAQRHLELTKTRLNQAKANVAAQIQAEANAVALQVKLTRQQLGVADNNLAQFNGKAVQYDILKHEADSDKAVYDDLLQRVNSADIDAGFHSNALRIVTVAQPNRLPVAPNVPLTILLAGLLSTLLGVTAAIAASSLDRTLRDPDTAAAAVGALVLASLPAVRRPEDLAALAINGGRAALQRRSEYAEAILQLRSTLELSSGGLNSLAITSAQPREGKTTVAVNLACAFAVLGRRIVLVDADIRRPEVHRQFGLPNQVGLSNILEGEAGVDECLQPGPVEGLTVITAGPSVPNPGELLAANMARLIEELKSRFDFVLVDTPPMLGFADALSASTSVDGMLLVARAGQTPRDLVRAAIQQLRHVRAPIAGLVLNGFSPGMSHHYYYHRDYYTRYYARDREDAAGEDAADATTRKEHRA